MKRYQIANYKCLVVKYSKDDRYDKEGIATHDRQTLSAIPADVLDQVKAEAENYEVIGIDEGQFSKIVIHFIFDGKKIHVWKKKTKQDNATN